MAWYLNSGPESDVVLSSRIRLARNLDTFLFPLRLEKNKSDEVTKTVVDAINKYKTENKRKFNVVYINQMGQQDKLSLAEKHLISEELIDDSLSRCAIIENDESVSIMVNEEDHIRIQAMEAGLNLEKAYEKAQDIACFLEKELPVAFSEKFGFLTACPTNTGTGLRASVIMHLPGLDLAKKIQGLIERISKMGYSVRGYYGEHSNSVGNMFQISNQITLGLNEEELVSDLKKLINQIIDQERALRRDIYENNPIYVEDMVYRSLGTLKFARVLTSQEALKMISDIRLGTSLGIIKDIEVESINRILNLVGPASLQKSAGKEMEPKERDEVRADAIRKQLKDGDKL